jgi:hypothetical protein
MTTNLIFNTNVKRKFYFQGCDSGLKTEISLKKYIHLYKSIVLNNDNNDFIFSIIFHNYFPIHPSITFSKGI